MKKLLTALLLLLTQAHSHAETGALVREHFTSAVIDREPVDVLERISPELTRVYFFTELEGLSGRTVTHQWRYHDKVLYEKSFAVGGPRWRIWTTMAVPPDMQGVWQVKTLDESGKPLPYRPAR